MVASAGGVRASLMARGAAAVVACGAAGGVTAAAVRQALALSPAYPVKVIATFGAVMVVALAGLGAHPHPRFGPANVVTTVRAALVALLAALAGEAVTDRAATAAFAVGMMAAACDGLDGRLARRTGLASPFGARFDMETDALLIMVLSVLVWQLDKAGPWVLASGLMRYAFVAAGWLWPWLEAPLPRRWRRQAVCVVQVVTLVVLLLPTVGPRLGAVAAAASLALLAWSFGVDVAWLWRARQAAGLSEG